MPPSTLATTTVTTTSTVPTVDYATATTTTNLPTTSITSLSTKPDAVYSVDLDDDEDYSDFNEASGSGSGDHDDKNDFSTQVNIDEPEGNYTLHSIFTSILFGYLFNSSAICEPTKKNRMKTKLQIFQRICS